MSKSSTKVCLVSVEGLTSFVPMWLGVFLEWDVLISSSASSSVFFLFHFRLSSDPEKPDIMDFILVIDVKEGLSVPLNTGSRLRPSELTLHR